MYVGSTIYGISYIYNIDMTYIWVALKISYLKTPSTTWRCLQEPVAVLRVRKEVAEGGKGCHLEMSENHTWNLKHPLRTCFFFPWMMNQIFTWEMVVERKIHKNWLFGVPVSDS